MRSRLACVFALCGWMATAIAAAPTAQEQVLELVVNGQAGVVMVLEADASGHLHIAAPDLATLRLQSPATPAYQRDGVEWYALQAIPGITLARDDQRGRLVIDAPSQAFAATELSLYAESVDRADTGVLGAYLNYDLYAEDVDTGFHAGASLDVTAFAAGGSVGNGLLVESGPEGQRVTRLDTSYRRDFQDRLTSLTLGDAVTTAGSWGRSLRFAGVRYGTDFGLRPDLVTTPLLGATGTAAVPSVVDVYVNQQLVGTREVPPGPFDIGNIPALTGTGEVNLVVRDAAGRETLLTQPFYTSPQMLRDGLSQWSIELGTSRANFGRDSFDYRDALAAATYRRGYGSALTLEGHFEYLAGDAHAIGGQALVGLGRLGVLAADLAWGSNGRVSGAMVGLGFERVARRLSLALRGQWFGAGFRQPGMAVDAVRPEYRLVGTAGIGLGRYGSLSLAALSQTEYGGPGFESIALNYSLSLQQQGFIVVSASHTSTGASSSDSVFVTWVRPLGDGRDASLSVESQQSPGVDSQVATASVQRSLPRGSGLGYGVAAQSDGDYRGRVDYQGSAGRVTTELARERGKLGARAAAAGAVGYVGGERIAARRVDSSVAVVDVGGMAGLPVYLDNQPVAVTNARGRAVITELRPYERNRLSIDPTRLPLDARLQKARVDFVPAARSGLVVRFPVKRVRSATLKLSTADGSALPRDAIVTVDGRDALVGADGLVFLEDLAGDARVSVRSPTMTCDLDVRLPADGEPIPHLGDFACGPLAP